jgi:hypothetical protein
MTVTIHHFFLKGAKIVGENPTAFLIMMVVWVFTIYTEVDPKGVQKGKKLKQKL